MTGTTAGSTPVSHSPPAVTSLETLSLTPIQPLTVLQEPTTTDSLLTASSIASHDTFMTALTSDQSSTSPTTSRLNAASPHSLRKSISVDSFIKNRRSPDLSEPGPSSSGHSCEYSRESFHPGASNSSDLEDWNYRPRYTVTNGQHPPSATKSFASRIFGRSRGHSLSSPSTSDYDDPYLDDSDHERTADMAHLPLLPSHRSRSLSSTAVNGVGKGKAKARPGDVLLLPPRTPTLSNVSSASSLNSVANSAAFGENVPPVPPIPHHHSRRPNAPGPLVMPRRPRSSSLSAKNSTSSWGLPDAVFSIAVVGPPGCGKSTVIKKGLRAWGVSEESICTVATPQGLLRYGSRTINAPRDDEKVAHVLELDSNVLSLDSPGGAWPKELPPIDGVLVCYDASDPASFARVPDLLACYHALHLSAVAMACKCDLDKKVLPHHASERAAPYNVGLVEVTSLTDFGKRKMRHCFHWIIRAVQKSKRGEIPAGSPYRNPASPDVLNAPPWSEGYGYPEVRTGGIKSHGSTPSAGSPSTTTKPREPPFAAAVQPASPTPGTSTPTPRSPALATSPPRVKSTNDLISEVERRRQEMRRESPDGRGGVLGRTASTGSLRETLLNNEKDDHGSLERIGSTDVKEKSFVKPTDPPPMVWATLDELLDKIFFVAVSGDDPTFIKYFFLTYRRFATPRSILLGMQKRVRQLNKEHSDLLLGSYAQMRICNLLEGWIEDYPTDFATPGASGAITALVKQISTNACTLHYGSDILPFLDELTDLQDGEASWSVHEDLREESDDDEAELMDDEEAEGPRGNVMSDTIALPIIMPLADPDAVESKPKLSTRQRKGSLPLSTRSTTIPLSTTLSGASDPSNKSLGGMPKKNSPRELVKVAQTLATYDPTDVAQQITKMQSDIFLAIEPRQWFRYTMGDAKSCPGEPITASANFYNQVSSLILAHDKVRLRERQVERFIELAAKLRTLNNYVGLRAVKTGINNATFPNDEIMTILRDNKLKLYQLFLSWEVLLNSASNHRAYRMAIRHTSGPGIPDMEVHTFDMVRANESNADSKEEDPSKIHWGKFTLMARMVLMLQGLQDKIRSSGTYGFPERKWIRELLNADVMDIEAIRSRVFPPPDDAEPIFPLSQQSVESPSGVRTEAARLKRLLFW
ncbi:hypothetical protein JB92DRAFT_3119551 [Gautieria morchelliformis]|nr:hypothetical protein JB92DRAFT_3119551 [Gautieria morchelliformis]